MSTVTVANYAGIDSQLGAVKPWVRSAAEQLTSTFGLTTVSGYRAGDSADPTTGHTSGLAVDFPASVAVGDKLVAYVQANATALGVKYLIWQQRIWYPAKGWSAMAFRPGSRAGYDPNHLRHVHVSWTTTAPTGTAAATTAAPAALTTGVSMNPLDPSTWGNALMPSLLKLTGVAAGLTLIIMGLSRIVAPAALGAVGKALA